MNRNNKYNNYDLFPTTRIAGYDNESWEGIDNLVYALQNRAKELFQKQDKVVLCMDAYPGVDIENLLRVAKRLDPDRIYNTEELAKKEEERRKEFSDYITDDRVFGIICHKKLDCFFEHEKLQRTSDEIQNMSKGFIIVAGLGAGLISKGDIFLYCDMTRWEIQLRYRKGMPNWCCNNGDEPVLSKYKIGFFIEWRLADRYKRAYFDDIDYLMEYENPTCPKMVTGKAFRSALELISKKPFRLEPYFDPGVWGGHWMQQKFDVGKEKENLAWSFDGVPEENALNLQFGSVSIKIPAMDLVLYRPHELLGERVHGRYGAEFPIRFDLLDTMGGGNLSLQVHPLTEYIQDNFGMHYTQDESYYLLDTDETEETYVYLGVKKNADKKAMEEDLRRAEKGEIEFPAEKYVNKVPVKKHDHVLIPAGTIHCSGKDTMVLEISATPYIFTFKLWDWGRVGLDGVPRPIHIEHGMKNIQWDRDEDWIKENVLHQEKLIKETSNQKIERTGLHDREPIDTIRYTTSEPVEVDCDDSVNVCNLVDGECVRLESLHGEFEPFVVHYAETCIIPAAVNQYRIVPENGEIMLIVASIRR